MQQTIHTATRHGSRGARHGASILILAMLLSSAIWSPLPGGADRASATGIVDGWMATGSMTVPRSGQTATLLPDGRVLVAGGCCDAQGALASAELYDPRTGIFTSTTPMATGRTQFSATLLRDGTVLVVGGCNSGDCTATTPETYDPRTATWTPTGPFVEQGFHGHTATLLPDGRVLIAGGCPGNCAGGGNFAALYNPRTRGWSATGSMAEGRADATATLLPNGRVLIAGGCDFGCTTATAELYDPATGSFTPTTGGMVNPRVSDTATLLPDGRVLIAGGCVDLAFPCSCAALVFSCSSPLATAELYDPATETFTTTGRMITGRTLATATLLPSGRVLVAGGCTSYNNVLGSDTCHAGTASAELYDPNTGTWTATGALSTTRVRNTATLLSDGRVLAAGGDCCGTAEVYTPGLSPLVQLSRMTLSLGDQLAGAAGQPQLVTLTNTGSAPLHVADVAVTGADAAQFRTQTPCMLVPLRPGGQCSVAVSLAPQTMGSFTASLVITDDAPTSPQTVSLTGVGTGPFNWFDTNGPMSSGRSSPTLTPLLNGKILIAGGCGAWCAYIAGLSSAELYDPSTGTFTPTGSMATARGGHTATLLRNGQVLVAGGATQSDLGPTAAAELYNPRTGTWTPTGSMSTPRIYQTATLLPNGQVLVVGGNAGDQGNPLASAELYNPSTGTFTSTGSLSVARQFHTATLLPDGKVLVAGGCAGNCVDVGGLSSAELYDPSTGTFTPTGSLTTARGGHTATLLQNGQVLVAGGLSQNDLGFPMAAAELYNPRTGTWTPTASMGHPRASHTATLLPTGQVLVAGGFTDALVPLVGLAVVSSAELYDPATGSWTPTFPLTVPRENLAATLLPNGDALVVGGDSCQYIYSCPGLTSAEVYHPTFLRAFPAIGSAGQHVYLQGRNFFGNEPVDIYWDSVTATPLATAISDRLGDLAATVTVPAAGAGLHVLVAVGQRSGTMAYASIIVRP